MFGQRYTSVDPYFVYFKKDMYLFFLKHWEMIDLKMFFFLIFVNVTKFTINLWLNIALQNPSLNFTPVPDNI